jgi:hypothetical protein
MVGVELYFSSDKVAAIKFMRALTGCGLYEARQAAVDPDGNYVMKATFVIENSQFHWLVAEAENGTDQFRKAIVGWRDLGYLPTPFRLTWHLSMKEEE